MDGETIVSGEVLAIMISETRGQVEEIRADTEAIRNMINFLVSCGVLGFYAWLLWSYRGNIARILTGWAGE